MGILWAAVTNKSGDAISYEGEPTEDGNARWSLPSVEIADETQAKQAAKSDQMNFVIGAKGWVFGFEHEGTTFTPTPMSTSGHSDALELLRELESSKATMVCVEFPGANFRTCFSLAGAAEALGDDSE